MSHHVEVPQSHADLLDIPGIATLATVGADGVPQLTAVCYFVDDHGLKVSFTADRQKAKNLANNPNATLFIIDPANSYRTLEIRATVKVVDDSDLTDATQLATKYNLDLGWLASMGDRVTAIFEPVKVVAQAL